MSTYPPGLASHIGRDVTTVCHCWRLTRRDGAVSGFTDHDLPLTVDGTLFEPRSGFSASEARDTLGLAVDTVDVEGALSSDTIRDEDIAAGLYDGARVETLLVNWRAPGDFARLRSATIGKLTRGEGRFVAELESLMHTLDQSRGRYVTRSCDAELGDARCGFSLDRPGFRASGIVLSLAGADAVAVAGFDGLADGWFTHGVLNWTSGARAGRIERVAVHGRSGDGVSLTLTPSVGPRIEAGDGFTIAAGCDKSFATCKAKFGNAPNFRGFPHLPGNDAAYTYVTEGGAFDGGPLVP